MYTLHTSISSAPAGRALPYTQIQAEVTGGTIQGDQASSESPTLTDSGTFSPMETAARDRGRLSSEMSIDAGFVSGMGQDKNASPVRPPDNSGHSSTETPV